MKHNNSLRTAVGAEAAISDPSVISRNKDGLIDQCSTVVRNTWLMQHVTY